MTPHEPSHPSATPSQLEFVERSMRALCENFDWSRTPLGARPGWPQSLRTAVQVVLAMPQPALLTWGADFCCVYNDALREILGRRHGLGRSLAQLWPEYNHFHRRWWPRLRGGESVRSDIAISNERTPGTIETLWFSSSSVPVQDVSGRVAGTLSILVDTTARKGAEARHAFLLEMSDRLRALEDPNEIRHTATCLLGEYLRVNRALFVEIVGDDFSVVPGYVHDVDPFPSGRHPLAAYGAELLEQYRRGESVAVDDVTNDPRITPDNLAMYRAANIAAFASVILLKGTRMAAAFVVHSAMRRRWTREDLELIREGAERLWADAERARAERALRESESRQSFLLALTDRIRAHSDPREIMRSAAEMLGTHLDLASVLYAWVEQEQELVTCAVLYKDGTLPGIVEGARYRFADLEGWGAALCAGQEVFSDDYAHDARNLNPAPVRQLSVRSGSAIPALRDGKVVAVLASAHSAPRCWTEAEKSLMREVAVRTWGAAERARAEAALRISEEQVRLAIQVASMFTWSVDAATDRYQLSPNVAEVLGYEPLMDYTATQAVALRASEEHAALHREAMARSLRGEGDMHLDHAMTHPKTGETVWLETNGTRVVDPITGLVRLIGVSKNITERKRAEAQLLETEARQAYLLALSDALRPLADPIAVQATAARVVSDHIRCARAYYSEIDEARGTSTARVGYVRGGGPDWAGTYPLESELLAVLRDGSISVMRDTADSTQVPAAIGAIYEKYGIRAQVTVPLIKEGRIVAAFMVTENEPRDWTPFEIFAFAETAERTWSAVERTKVELALRESEERFRAHLAATSDVLFRMSPDWSEMRALASGGTITDLGKSSETWMEEFVYPDDRASLETEIADAIFSKRVFHLEHRLQPLDGRVRWVATRAVPLFDEQGEIKEWFGAASDVTERREAQEEAERTSRAKDEFLATLSHELRTPLAAISLWAGALRTGSVGPTEVARAVDAIAQSAESQSRLIEDLLDLSRLTAGKLVLAPSPIDPGLVVRAAIDVVKPMAEAKRISLDVDIEGDLGIALFDSARLKQILWNLMSNAIKFTPEGGRVVLLAHKLAAVANPPRAAVLELTVADTGEGIAADFLPHVFERFRQADMGDTRAHAGLGIGLALTRQLVELQGGKVEVHSEGRGRGATFSVRLPWIDAQTSAAAVDGRAGFADESAGPLVGLTVLVVEDDVNTREAMQCVLVNAGARVLAVSSGFEALRFFGMSATGKGIAGSSPVVEPFPDLVVSDLGLPGMSGYELITRIAGLCRARGRRVPPACAVSAHAREVDRQRAIESGFDLHMVKPITPETLIEVVLDLADIAASQD